MCRSALQGCFFLEKNTKHWSHFELKKTLNMGHIPEGGEQIFPPSVGMCYTDYRPRWGHFVFKGVTHDRSLVCKKLPSICFKYTFLNFHPYFT